LAVLATGLALLTGMAMAQNETAPPATDHYRMRPGGFMGAPEMAMALRQLNLSNDQKAQVRQIFESEKAAIRPLRQREMAAQQQMIHLITSGSFDQAKASAIAAEESQAHLQLELEHAKIASQIYQGVLTADQKSQVTEMIARHDQRMQERMNGKGESAQPNE